MITSVNERCRAVATFRHVSIQLMETVARWTPTTPEMEAKVMFGKHIWGFAQMADALGKRAFELRKPLHYTIPPVKDYEALLDDVSTRESTSDRVAALYEGALPGLIERYRHYVATTDPVLDEPSIDIVDRIVLMLERQRAEATALRSELNLAAAATDICARDRAIMHIVAEQAPA